MKQRKFDAKNFSGTFIKNYEQNKKQFKEATKDLIIIPIGRRYLIID